MNADIGSLMHLLASGVASRDKLTELAILSINSKSCFSIFNAILARRLLDLRNVDLLVAAAEASDTRFLSALLDAGASMDTKLLPRLSESLLHVASSCSPAATAMLLKRGANPNTLDFSHARPLHAVCSRNFDIEKKIDAIKLLLAAGADVNAPTKDGRTALHCALRFNVAWTVDVVNVLLDAGANANAIDAKGVSVLEAAMRLQNFALTELLIRFGANVRRAFSDGNSPLHFAFVAASWDHAELVPTLLHAGVDLNAIDRLGNTALHFLIRKQGCAKKFDVDLVGQLIKAGAKCDIANADGQTPLGKLLAFGRPSIPLIRLLLDAGAPVETKSSRNGRTSCHIAVKQNNRQFVEELISKRGANVNAIANSRETPLIIAARKGANDVVSVLINAGAQLDMARRPDGATALHLAVKNGHTTIADALIAAGANVNVKDAGGWTPCHFAIALGDGERVRRLIDAGASVNCRRKTSESLLHVALLTAKDDVIIRMLVAEGVKLNATACRVAACNAAALRALIDAGAVFDQPDVDRDRTTPLSIAVKTGNIECASVLVAAGANVKWVDKHSNTLLHLLLSSTENINMARVRLLVAWGVDVNARNANGESAFTIVARKGNRECLCTLLAIGASLTETTSVSRDVSGLLAAAAGDDKPGLAAARSQLVRARGAEVCIGLQSLQLDALQMSEILQFACTGAGQHVPFHLLWNIAVKAKHFVKSTL